MAFLLLLLVSLVSVVQVETRAAARQSSAIQVRSLAFLGLQEAVGELQRHAGRDQAATAPASVFDATPEDPAVTGVSHPHWTGVWRSEGADWSDPLNDAPPDYDGRAGDPAFFGRWLVSGTDADTTAPDSALDDAPGGDWVTLVGSDRNPRLASLTAAEAAALRVQVPGVSIPEASGQGDGRIAYWVGGEATKAKVNVAADLAESGEEGRRDFIGAPRFALEHVEAGSDKLGLPEERDSLNEALADLGRVDDLASLAWVSGLDGGAEVPLRRFHDLTATATGLLTDNRNGGLRRDLTRFLGDTPLAAEATPPAAAELADFYGDDPAHIIHFRNDQDTLGERERYFSLLEPSWRRLQSYYELAEEYEADGSITARIGDENEESVSPVVTQAGYSVFPGLDLNLAGGSIDRRVDADGNGLPDSPMEFVAFMEFQAVLWNPYNVPLRIPGEGMLLDFLHAERFNVASYRIRPGFNLVASNLVVDEADVAFLGPFYTGDFKGATPTEGIIDVFDEKMRDDSADAVGLSFRIPGGTELAPGEVAIFSIDADIDYETASQNGGPLLSKGNSGAFVRFRQEFDIQLRSAIGNTVAHPYPVNGPILDEIATPDGDMLSLENLVDKSIEFYGEQIGNIDQVALSRGGFNRVTLRRPLDEDDNTVGAEDLDNLYLYREGGGHPAAAQRPPDRARIEEFGAAQLDGGDPLLANQLNYFYRTVVGDTEPGDNYYVSNIFNPIEWLGQLNPRARTTLRTEAENRAGSTTFVFNAAAAIGWNYEAWPISSNGDDAFFGNSQRTGGQTRVVAVEIPRKDTPPGSLAALQHANLFDINRTPAYATGHSQPHFHLPGLDAVAGLLPPSNKVRFPAQPITADTSYLLNRALWDSWFLSSIDSDSLTAANVSANTLERTNERYRVFAGDRTAAEVAAALRDPATAAAHLLVDGPFNVNSTSVEAWKALLGAGNRLAFDPSSEGGTAGPALANPYSRFAYPQDGSTDGAAFAPETWNGFHELDDAEITALAEAIVAEVKRRGPFLTLAEFVNRRIENSPAGRQGALDQAIADADINDTLADTSLELNASTKTAGGDSWLLAAYEGHSNEDAPGWLSQADILRKIGPYLSVRSDTFRIRAYGALDDPVTGYPTAEAWCEAIVQRVAEPVTATGGTGRAAWTPADNFGRRFEVVAFRWLTEEEI